MQAVATQESLENISIIEITFGKSLVMELNDSLNEVNTKHRYVEIVQDELSKIYENVTINARYSHDWPIIDNKFDIKVYYRNIYNSDLLVNNDSIIDYIKKTVERIADTVAVNGSYHVKKYDPILKFTTTVEIMRDIIAQIKPIVPRRSTLPVLEYARFNLFGNTVNVQVTDCDIFAQFDLVDSNSEGCGSFILPFSVLKNLCVKQKKLETISVTFDTIADIYTICIGPITFSGKCINESEFPIFPKMSVVSSSDIKLSNFISAMKHTLPFVAKDDSRPIFHAMYIDTIDSGYRVCGADTFRLSKELVAAENYTIPPFLLPYESAATLINASKYISNEIVTFSLCNKNKDDQPTRWLIKFDHAVILGSLTQGNYPNVDHICFQVPQSGLHHVELLIDRKNVLEGLESLNTLKDDFIVNIKLDHDSISFIRHSEDKKSVIAKVSYPACFDNFQQELDMLFNVNNLIDALRVMPSDTPMIYMKATEALHIADGALHQIIMPLYSKSK